MTEKSAIAENCVIYTRSSKDRADISPAAQRKDLQAFARRQKYRIVAEFSDAAVSANDKPPQLAQMLGELKNPKRGWTVICAVDSSRLARDVDLAGVISYNVKKAGCRIEYAKMPTSGNAAMDMMMSSLSRAWDEYFSMISKEKGLGGMRENIESGHRSGGRAPFGYALKHTSTGTMRGGEEVLKSQLVLDPEWAPRVKEYLQLRLQGLRRIDAAASSGLAKKPQTTLISVERNALTYAGHTVWNRAPDRKAANGHDKFRPRAEWVIKKGTHTALITEAEAEALMARVMPRGPAVPRGPSGKFLLSGFLFTPAGAAMVSSGDKKTPYYRAGKGRRVPAALIEQVVLDHMNEEVDSHEFIDRFVNELRSAAASIASDPAAAKVELKRLDAEIAKLIRLAAKVPESAALANNLRKLESDRAQCEDKITRAAENAALARGLTATTPAEVRRLIKRWTEQDAMTIEERRAAIAQLVERIEFDPETGTGRIHYRISPRKGAPFNLETARRELGLDNAGECVASPGGFEPPYSP